MPCQNLRTVTAVRAHRDHWTLEATRWPRVCVYVRCVCGVCAVCVRRQRRACRQAWTFKSGPRTFAWTKCWLLADLINRCDLLPNGKRKPGVSGLNAPAAAHNVITRITSAWHLLACEVLRAYLCSSSSPSTSSNAVASGTTEGGSVVTHVSAKPSSEETAVASSRSTSSAGSTCPLLQRGHARGSGRERCCE